jgi:hypothetical protein
MQYVGLTLQTVAGKLVNVRIQDALCVGEVVSRRRVILKKKNQR